MSSILDKNPFEISRGLNNKDRNTRKNYENKIERALKERANNLFEISALNDPKRRKESLKLIGLHLVVKDKLKTSQIRKFLSLINKVYLALRRKSDKINEIKDELYKMQTMLIYSAGRNSSVVNFARLFFNLIEDALNEKDEEKFKAKVINLYENIQAIVAYHKLFGGKD